MTERPVVLLNAIFSQVNCTQHDKKLLKNSNRSLPSLKSPQSRATSPPRYQNRPFSPNAPYHGPHHHQHCPQQQEGGHQDDAHQGGQRPSPRLAASLPKLNTIQVNEAGRQIFKPTRSCFYAIMCLFLQILTSNWILLLHSIYTPKEIFESLSL